MTRVSIASRPDYVQKVEQLGLNFHTLDGQQYWNESAYYRLSADEVDQLESATNELMRLCLEAVDVVISNNRMDELCIPKSAQAVIRQVWDQDPPSIYGRFDLAFDGINPPRMLEFNADTPTSLLEAAVIQWHWLQELFPDDDQFNSIWEALVQKWKDLLAEGYCRSKKVHFACDDVPEDIMTTAVLMDTAHEAGISPILLGLSEITWHPGLKRFIDPSGEPFETVFKLYPWEWMLQDEFGPLALETMAGHQWIEPIWKMILSNKSILAILWEMAPNHPNLLPAYLDGPRGMTEYVKKPILGREGANVTIVRDEQFVSQGGEYEEGPFCYQAYSPLPEFDGNHAVIGLWVVDCTACGIGIRESDGPITHDLARFAPHAFTPRKQ